MALPLMPKATAVWLVENTTLSFEQIADFCGMHELEVQAIADGEVAQGIVGLDPVANGQLDQFEINRCQKSPTASLRLKASANPVPQARPKGTRYTPVSKRHDRPDGIAWILKNHPEITDAQVCKLLGTTKPTIQSIRERTHWNAANIKARNPVTLGLCSEADLEKAIALSGVRRAGMSTPVPEPVHFPSGDIPGEGDEPDPEPRHIPAPEPTAESVFGTTPRQPVDDTDED